jgi:hypothetical protein
MLHRKVPAIRTHSMVQISIQPPPILGNNKNLLEFDMRTIRFLFLAFRICFLHLLKIVSMLRKKWKHAGHYKNRNGM